MGVTSPESYHSAMRKGSGFDVIVVGVGAMGSSTCYHLARRGVRVLGLEQFDIPHARGSSHGQSRMIRMAYYEHPDYVPLLRRSYELWHELEQVSGQKLLHITGGVYMGPPDGEVVPGSLQSARQHGLAHEPLDRAAVAKRFPQFTIPDDWVALYEPLAGFLLPERTVAAYAEAALRSGAELHGNEPVTAWRATTTGVTVRTTRGEYEADRLVFCGGPWSSKLLADLGVPLVVTRQVLGWVWPRNPDLFAMGRLPVWAIEKPGGIYYGFPMMSDCPGFKLADHSFGTPTDPDRVAREVTAEDEQTFRPAITKFIPDADGPTLAIRTCLYTHSPDRHFILDRHPVYDNVTLACGFSGHGFKFASVVGEVMADLATEGTTRLPAQFLGLHRFSDGGSEARRH
jgi:sarcosine oxidase